MSCRSTRNRSSVPKEISSSSPGTTVLKVHRSNFTVEGFTEEVALDELAALCRENDCPLIYDAGSGALYPYTELGLPAGERLLAEDLAAGPDLVTCSGDKLLGGCQAGIILGRRALIAALRKHPMRRAFRVDKTTLAALDAVLGLYLEAEGRLEASKRDAQAKVVLAEASQRQFFRIHIDDRTLVLMQSPPALERNDAFVALSRVLGAAGIPVPKVQISAALRVPAAARAAISGANSRPISWIGPCSVWPISTPARSARR